MRNWYAFLGIKLDVLQQKIRIRFLPIPARTVVPWRPAKVPPVCLIPIRLHETRRTPRVCVDGLDAVPHSLVAKPDLPLIVAVPLVVRLGVGPARVREDHVVGRLARADAVADDAEARARGAVEHEVEGLGRQLLGDEVAELGSAAKGLGDAEAVDFLQLLRDIDRHLRRGDGCEDGKSRCVPHRDNSTRVSITVLGKRRSCRQDRLDGKE